MALKACTPSRNREENERRESHLLSNGCEHYYRFIEPIIVIRRANPNPNGCDDDLSLGAPWLNRGRAYIHVCCMDFAFYFACVAAHAKL